MKFLRWLIRKIIFITLGIFVIGFIFSKYTLDDKEIERNKSESEVYIIKELENLEPMACDTVINLALYITAKKDKDIKKIKELMEKNCTPIGRKALSKLGNDVIKNMSMTIKGEDQASCLLEIEISGVTAEMVILREDKNKSCYDLVKSYY